MNKENNRSAAGLRRSAVVERIRLREEWSELKGTPDVPLTSHNRQQNNRVLTKKPQSRNNVNRKPVGPSSSHKRNLRPNVNNVAQSLKMSSEVLVGVVALVEVGAEPRALALRAALGALGATVVPAWSPLVTHVIWSEGGCRATRARARALASRLVSPLWVEACAAAARRLPEQAFPAAARASDLPSPRTLRQLLKKAEAENIPLVDLLSDDKEDDKEKAPRLRMSSETEMDTSTDRTTDESHDTSHDTSADASRDKTDIGSRVNTAPRRAMPISTSPPPPAKSRRKLFTQKEAEQTKKKSDDETDAETTAIPTRARAAHPRPTPKERKGLARAERLARRLVAACAPTTQPAARVARPRIVLTGMGRTERQAVSAAIRELNGRLQSHVTWKTTHVLLGSCQEDDNGNICSGITTNNRPNISGVICLDEPRVIHRSDILKARTLNALLGAARGCRVLQSQWALDSLKANKWLHHHGYEVPHLRKISQKARIERTALCRMRSDYAYDVFSGMRVRVSPQTEQRDAALQLLKLCGAVTIDGDTGQTVCSTVPRDGATIRTLCSGMPRDVATVRTLCSGAPRDGATIQDYDMIIGVANGEVSSKWVFDSVAAGRMRTARRYKNNSISGSVLTQSNR